MKKVAVFFAVLVAALGVALAGFYNEAAAGAFKRLDGTENLAVGSQLSVRSSPLNTGAAMQMDYWEWRSTGAGGNYRCRVTSNGTNRPLNIRMIGVNGTVVGSCTAAVGGVCDTPTLALVGNLMFACLVATQNGAPVNAGVQYVAAVQRL